MWPDTRIQELFGIELPIIQAPMAGAMDSKLVIAVATAGGLGSLPCAMLTPERIAAEVTTIRDAIVRPVHLNFFCHAPAAPDPERDAAWQGHLSRYYAELGIATKEPPAAPARTPFDEATCDRVVELHPEIVSFHFGLPAERLLDRVRRSGAKIVSSATTVAEARWLEERGCDAIIAQGYEAGGHRGVFLHEDVSTQAGLFALLPQVVDAVKVPVIAAGGIADARGVVAAFALGAAAVQLGTAYLACPEAKLTPLHRAALRAARDDSTALTNVFTGRPARGIVNRAVREIGPLSRLAPPFPRAAGAIAPLRGAAEAGGSSDFSPLWSGQAAALNRELPATELTRRLAEEALAKLAST